MIRTGATDQLLEVLAQGDALRLRNVGSQSWEGLSEIPLKCWDIELKPWQDTHHPQIWDHTRITWMSELKPGRISSMIWSGYRQSRTGEVMV
jgi:hypothetical protein